MFQEGEYEAAAAFLEEFDRSFGKTPLAPDVLLLHAMIDLKSCEFDRRARDAGQAGQDLRARCRRRSRRCSRIRTSGPRSTGACSASASIGMPRDPIIELLKIDPRFYKFYADIVALDREAGLVPAEVAVWDELTAHEAGQHGASNATEAVRLVNDVEALRPLAAGDPADGGRRSRTWRTQARRAARLGNVGGGRFAKEARDDAGAGRRGAQAARRSWSSRPAPSPTRRWSTSTSGCASCCAGRASRTSTPSSARRRSWRSRSRTCARDAIPPSCSRRCSSRG